MLPGSSGAPSSRFSMGFIGGSLVGMIIATCPLCFRVVGARPGLGCSPLILAGG